MRKLPIRWTIGLQGKEKEDLETYIANSTLLSNRLCEIILEDISSLERKQLQEEFYETPELTNRLCFLNGQLAAYNKILSLFKGINNE